jgi:hypothetical protein
MTATAPTPAPENVTGPITGPGEAATSLPFGLTKGQMTGLLIVAGICGGVLLALWFTQPRGQHAPGVATVEYTAAEPDLCYCDAATEPHVHTEELAFVPPDLDG